MFCPIFTSGPLYLCSAKIRIYLSCYFKTIWNSLLAHQFTIYNSTTQRQTIITLLTPQPVKAFCTRSHPPFTPRPWHIHSSKELVGEKKFWKIGCMYSVSHLNRFHCMSLLSKTNKVINLLLFDWHWCHAGSLTNFFIVWWHLLINLQFPTFYKFWSYYHFS